MKKWKSHRFKFCYCYERDGVVYTSVHSERKSTGLKWMVENKDLAMKILHQRYITYATGQGYTLQDGIDRFFELRKADFKNTKNKMLYKIAFRNIFTRNVYLRETKKIQKMMSDFMNKSKLEASSKNQYLRQTKTFFAFLEEEDMIESNPVKSSMFLKERKEKKRPFTEKEVKYILDNTEGELHRFCLIASLTGMRKSEILNIKEKDVRDNHLLIYSTKTNKRRMYPLDPFPELKNHLRAFDFNENQLTYAFSQKLKELNLHEPGMGFHAFRRYAVNNLIKRIGISNANLYYLSQIFGHTVEVMEKNYLQDIDIETINKWLK